MFKFVRFINSIFYFLKCSLNDIFDLTDTDILAPFIREMIYMKMHIKSSNISNGMLDAPQENYCCCFTTLICKWVKRSNFKSFYFFYFFYLNMENCTCRMRKDFKLPQLCCFFLFILICHRRMDGRTYIVIIMQTQGSCEKQTYAFSSFLLAFRPPSGWNRW